MNRRPVEYVALKATREMAAKSTRTTMQRVTRILRPEQSQGKPLILSLRGTNGSGKSTVIRALMAQCTPKPIYGLLGPRLPEAYLLDLPKCKQDVFLLGPYITDCGGCDRILPYDNIPELIKKYAARGHVLFEGIIVTSVYGQVGTLMEQWKKNSIFLFLDTVLEECLHRIESRRGKPRDARLIKNVSLKYESALRVKKRVLEDNIMQAIDVSSETASETILKLLQNTRASNDRT